jgi:hypothetical protein
MNEMNRVETGSEGEMCISLGLPMKTSPVSVIWHFGLAVTCSFVFTFIIRNAVFNVRMITIT